MYRIKGEIDIVGYYDVELPKIPIILDDVRCRGSESSLIQCPNTGIANHNCVHYEDIVLDCRGTIHIIFSSTAQWQIPSTILYIIKRIYDMRPSIVLLL